MKNLIILCALFLSTVVMGQGNLQFNRVVNEEFSAYGGGNSIQVGTLTVPANKILKLEFISSYSSLNSGYNGGWKINNFTVKTSSNNNVLWLKEGTYDISAISSINPFTTWVVAISGIEFNIVP